MKKNFFKKLSFVLALAMIVSVLAPAAGAFAATAPKLSAKTMYLYLGDDTKGEYDFNISNKQTGWKYLWSSANENAAEVNAKNGLTTATGAGSTKVSVVITDKNGEEKAELTATVVVRDNIKELTITNVPTDNKLAVGVTNDFNRSYVTVAGKKSGSEAKTAWAVTKDGKATTDATIDANGVFVAKTAGEYVVEARAFQSSAKRTAFVTDPVKYASYVTSNVASVKITVAASIKTVKQVNLTKFTVEFDSDMSKSDLSATTAKLFQVINGTKVATGTEKIKEVKLDATGKIATVEMYSNFVSKVAYEFNYGALVGTFTAANKSLDDIASIQFADVSATINSSTGTSLKEKVTGLNKDGVVIYNGKDDNDFAGKITFTGDLTSNGFVDSNGNVYIYTKGFSTTLTAKFSHYVYNTTTKVYDTLTFEDTAVVTGTEVDANLNASTMQYLISTGTAPTNDTKGWATTGFTLAAKDTGYYINTRFKNNNATSDTTYTIDTFTGAAGNTDKFTYVSNDTDKLIINGDYLYPIAAGTVTVLVKNNDTNKTVVGTFDLTIQSARAFASAAIDTPSVSVGNNASLGTDGKVATITVLDTMGSKATTTNTAVNLVTGPTGATQPGVTLAVGTGDELGKVFVNVNSKGSTAGAYQYKLTVKVLGTEKDVFLTVVVVEGNKTVEVVNSWRLELDKTSVDRKNVKAAQPIAVGVYGYNANGVRVKQLLASEYTLTVKKGSTDINTTGTWYTNSNIDVAVAPVTPSVITALEVNTYAVEAKINAAGALATGRADGSQIGFATFAVTDTTTKSFVVEDPTVATGEVLKMVQDAFILYLNGEKITNEASIAEIVYNDGMGADKTWTTGASQPVGVGTSVYVKSIKYNVLNGTDTVATTDDTVTQYKYDVNVTIKAE